MRVLAQRVTFARVTVGGETVGEIGPGLALLVGVTHGDGEREAALLADKAANLRVFDDAAGVMNRSALDLLAAGDPVGMLVVSQFTLYGDVRKGRRPSWSDAAPGCDCTSASPPVRDWAAAARMPQRSSAGPA